MEVIPIECDVFLDFFGLNGKFRPQECEGKFVWHRRDRKSVKIETGDFEETGDRPKLSGGVSTN